MERTSYSKLSRWNHWLTAVIVLTMLAIGLYFHEMPRGEEKLFWKNLHISIGTLGFLLVMFRVLWRMRRGMLSPLEQHGLLQRLSQLSHWLLLLGIVVMFITGPLTVWSAGNGLNVFGWFSIPSPMERMHDLHEWLEDVHAITGKTMMYLIGLHVVGAIWHMIKHRGHLAGRMWG